MPKQQMPQRENLSTVQRMKTYRSEFLSPFDIQIDTIRHFFAFGALDVMKKSFIFAASSDLVKDGQNAQQPTCGFAQRRQEVQI